MAKYEFKVGDRVQFKEWDEMGKEFGFCTDRDINTKCLFKKEMRHFCGTYATIENLIPFAGHSLVILCNFTTTGDTCWNITPDMLKPASTKKQTVDEPKKLETTYPTITAHVIEGKKTTVMLSDGRMGEATCYHKDVFDPAVGIAEAYKKALGIAIKPDKPKVVEVDRAAIVGEYVKIVKLKTPSNSYKIGDIIKVEDLTIPGVIGKPYWIAQDEYVVLENYAPEAKADTPKEGKPKPKRKFEVGKKYIIMDKSWRRGNIIQITDCVNTKYGLRYTFEVIKGEPYPCDFFYDTSHIERSLKPYEEPQVKKVKRMAKVGEWVKVHNSGEIKQVESKCSYELPGCMMTTDGEHLVTSERYVVLESYTPSK